MKKACFLLLILLLPFSIIAQRTQQGIPGDPKFAKALFLGGDYVTALKEYLLLIRNDSSNTEYLYNIGLCYLNTHIDKTLAVVYLEKVIGNSKSDPQIYYDLGRAYQYNNRFEEAITSYETYIKLIGKDDNHYIPATMQIEMCERAVKMMENPVNVTFENLGNRINSSFPDYNPYITRNEQFLYFTSKRSGNMGNLIDYDGYYTADIFMSENRYGRWDKSKRLSGMINTPLVEETGGLSPDGSYLFAFVDNLDAKLQLRYARKDGKSFIRMLSPGSHVNLQNNGANAACISQDRKILFFSRNSDIAENGMDIFMSRILPSGEWGPALNLGPVINTEFDDDYPYLAPDGKTLYFASVGHGSMGGFDIFKSVWDQTSNTWSTPENLGYPVNTTDDNTVISFTSSGRYAYLAALRPEGYGGLDIYRVVFNDVKQSYTTVIGYLKTDSVNVFDIHKKEISRMIDSLNDMIDPAYVKNNKLNDTVLASLQKSIADYEVIRSKGPKCTITLINKDSGKNCGTYRPNPINGRYVVITGPGNYTLKAVCEGYKISEASFSIENREQIIPEITVDIPLQTLTE
jgi:tetratricopeptide (TPR) repeat protein